MNRMAALRQYRNVNTQSEIHDASPHRLIQLLMEGGLSRIAQARGCMERGEMFEKAKLISKALDIIAGLREALDFKQGGELATDYARLYDFMTRHLVEANRSNNLKALDEVTKVLLELKMGWDGIAQQAAEAP